MSVTGHYLHYCMALGGNSFTETDRSEKYIFTTELKSQNMTMNWSLRLCIMHY